MNFGNNKTSDSSNLLINLSDKINKKRGGKDAALPIVSIYRAGKNIKKLLQKQQI